MATKKITEQVSFYARPTLTSMQRLAEEGKDIPDMKLLFGNFIPEDCLIHFPSPRGVGKSWLCMQLCIAIAGEWDSYLGEVINHHGNTLYLNNELSERIIKRRANRLLSNVPLPVKDNFKAMAYTTRNNLLDDLPNIIQIIQKLNPVLIVIDNLRMAFTNVDTNNNREITRLMFTLLALCQSSKTSIVVTDHFRKHTTSLLSESDLQTGSGVKTDLVDGDFFLRRSCQDKNLRILKRGKSRHFEEAEQSKLLKMNPYTMWFELKEEQVNEAEHVGIHQIRDKEEQKDIAVALRKSGKSFDEIARILNKGKGTIHRWLSPGDNKET
ncbi:hypothetical protein A9P82_08045 [Arachidicoccus ginsenosidimutans]|uniref:AAA family ATPase n=1 Tax=Arachidicoccus sp. BS20 TaxID=1850526 RepID=UPI0007F0FB9E|nr:AAA family ATPase [Arachidicoccus sp. BS20]ANI89246.1 hypothetical protein A9P82_08045 [Arachidicoccus sp. BS20]